MDYSHASTAFFYGVFFPLLFGIPLAIVVYSGYQIYYHKILPPTGRRRILAIFYFRLAAVFLIMWLPGLLLLFVTGAWLDPWVEWAGGGWSHLQGAVSALVSLLKPDIWKALVDFWLCRGEEEQNNFRSSFMTVVSFRRRSSTSPRTSMLKSWTGTNLSFDPSDDPPKPLDLCDACIEDIEEAPIEGESCACFLGEPSKSSVQRTPRVQQADCHSEGWGNITTSGFSTMEDESESERFLDDYQEDAEEPSDWRNLSNAFRTKVESDDKSILMDVCETEEPDDVEDLEVQ